MILCYNPRKPLWKWEYEKGSHEEKETTNRRNGKGSTKTVKSKNGTFSITMPRDRDGSFEPVLVPKRARMVEGLSDQITLLYAKGNSIRDIKDILKTRPHIPNKMESKKIRKDKIKKGK